MTIVALNVACYPQDVTNNNVSGIPCKVFKGKCFRILTMRLHPTIMLY